MKQKERPAQDLIREEYEGFYQEVGKRAKVPGFRPGKAPREVLETHFRSEAKEKVLELSHSGYVQKPQRDDITVLGRSGLSALYAGAASFRVGAYASDHDFKIAQKIAWVLCGGDLTSETKVTEQYLLDLEREAFLSLCAEKKTLERIQSILTSGKPLRN